MDGRGEETNKGRVKETRKKCRRKKPEAANRSLGKNARVLNGLE